jgi:uncharacterized membrane protein
LSGVTPGPLVVASLVFRVAFYLSSDSSTFLSLRFPAVVAVVVIILFFIFSLLSAYYRRRRRLRRYTGISTAS